MQTSVDLQGPFSYSFLLTIILIALVLLPLIIYVVFKLVHFKPKKRQKKVKVKKVKPVKIDPVTVKQKYQGIINTLENRYTKGEINERETYIELSSTVRNFVHDITGIDAQNFTLNEIKELNMPKLYELIEQFYRPEFSYQDESSDIKVAFADARSVVSQWK